MNWKTWAPLVLATVLGLIAAKAGHDVIIRANRAGAPLGSFTFVIVAKSDLNPGSSLSEADLTTVPMPSDTLPRTAFQKTTDLVGRVLVLPVVKGQAILEAFLAPAGSDAGLQALVPPGMRALSIEINESSGVAGLLLPGSHVDVVSTLADDTQRQPVARLIVQNATVLAVGHKLHPPTKKDDDDTPRPKTVTLLLMPRDVEAIELAGSAGKLRLVLRGSLDNSKSVTNGMTVAELLGNHRNHPEVIAYTPPPPQPTPIITQPVKTAVLRSVEVIRSGKIERVDMPGMPVQPPSMLTGDGMQTAPVIPDRVP